ncbi:MAG: ribosome silencing factor [Alphaproteobacteria bacterium]|nr:ribosome silencing factor [Alphaproteobacteria bacterium]
MATLKKKTPAKAKKATAKKPVAKKSAVKKTAAKKPAAKKIPAKKVAPSKKTAKKLVVKKSKANAVLKGIPEETLETALRVLDDRQAQEIATFTLLGRSSLADYMIIASGKTSRQVAALAENLREAFFKMGVRTVHIEGKQDANWVLVDTGDVIVHLFRPEVRTYYGLDALWSKKTSKK